MVIIPLGSDYPVIVTGQIVTIDRGAARAPKPENGKIFRLLDVAHIRISQVHKNVLTGVSTRVGQTITARMHSAKGRTTSDTLTIRTSGDLCYTIGTKALWLLHLDDDGHFTINRGPEQRQPVGSYDKIRRRDIQVLRREPARPPKPGELPSQVHTVKEWIDARRKARLAREEADRRHKALQAETTKAVTDLYADGTLQPARLPVLIDQRTEVRSKLANWSARQMGISRDDWVTISCYLARNDPVENHRVRALPGWISGSAPVRELLLESIRDESWRVRLFACQALMNADDKTVADKVAPLLADPKRWVRKVAVRTLGWLGARQHAKGILALYHKTENMTDAETVTFGVALARLGHLEVPLACFPKAMASDNWNIRWMAMGIIQTCQGPRIVPAIMAELPGELARAAREHRQSHIPDRVLLAMTAELAKRTDAQYGADIAAWMTWWSAMAPKHGATAPTQAQIAETKRIQTDYYRLIKRKVTPK